jgi:hypothetical protein
MSNIQDIFDLPQQTDKPVKEPKERKKVVMTDDKKAAMLERLAKGRETRANNLLAKKGQPKTEVLKEPVKEKEVKVDKSEEERKAFINTMVGKSKPVEKFERPKKKIITESLEAEPKVLKVEAPKVEAPKKTEGYEAPKKTEGYEIPKQSLIEAPKVEAPKQIKPLVMASVPKVIVQPIIQKAPEPVVIRTFKRAMW